MDGEEVHAYRDLIESLRAGDHRVLDIACAALRSEVKAAHDAMTAATRAVYLTCSDQSAILELMAESGRYMQLLMIFEMLTVASVKPPERGVSSSPASSRMVH